MSSKTTRRRTLFANAPLVCAALAALLAAPSPQTQSAAGADFQFHAASTPGPGDDRATVSDAFALATATLVEDRGRVVVSDVVMVVNDDGSAALSATFEGRGDAVALKSVHIESDAGELDVASTQMWLPILPGIESRAGDASDAGGFVVPRGVAPGQVVHVQFQFDNDTCLAIDAQAVRRNPTHDEVFPTNGKQLGPGKRIAAMLDCPRA
ncbi:MAG: hypothetical protein QOF58_6060 [Pseudonocardiales bacterium]|nr:hypothetical protein [Pseudonocardiales bacterium]